MLTGTVLDKIIARKWEEIEARKASVTVAELEQRIASQSAPRGFVKSIEEKIALDLPAVIAEVKKASPSKGVIRSDFKPPEIAKSYEAGGAACLSVLTDIDFFQGADQYLVDARNAVSIPVIRKDFIVDEYQLYEARALGADCILLIVAVLPKERLHALNNLAISLGLDVLVEVHDLDELELALELPNRLIGINNRNLHTFETSLANTYNLLDKIDDDRIVVTESGIHSKENVNAMLEKGVSTFLVGEAFMREEEPGEALAKMFFAS